MRIGIDIRNIGKQRTGDEAVFFNLVKNLAKIDADNQYVLFTDLAENLVPKIKQKLGVSDKANFEVISLGPSNKFLWNAWTLPRYLKKNPVDIYHTQYIIPFFVDRKIKIITHIHDVSFRAYPEFIKKSDLFFLKILIPLSLKRADIIIAVSEFTKNEIIKYYKTNPDKIEVVYNALGIDFSESDYSGNELIDIKNKYHLPQKFILYLGTLQPRKNIPLLIRSFAKIADTIPDCVLVIAGNRNAHNFDRKIDEEIKKAKIEHKVIFPGFIEEEDKKAIFELAQLFVYPSLYEGFGIPILEAFSAHVPALASDIPVHREVANNAVIYFKSSDLDDFSQKLYTTIADNNLKEKSTNLGLTRLQFFSWEKSAKKLLEIYKGLA